MTRPVRNSLFFLGMILLTACARTFSAESPCKLKFKLTEDHQLLLDKKWTESSIMVKNAGEDGGNLNVTNQFMRSDLDDVIIFKKDGTYVFDEGRSKARKESRQVYESGYWTYYKREAKLVLCAEWGPTIYDVIELEDQKLVLQLTENKDGKEQVFLLTYYPL